MRKLIAVLLAALLVVGTLVTAACSPAAETGAAPAPPATLVPVSADGTQRVSVEVGNGMRFDPSSIAVRAGQPVEVTLRNDSGISHDFTLSSGPAQPVKIVAAAGQTATGTFTIDTPGSYTFFCSVPGHEAAGRRGTITVQ